MLQTHLFLTGTEINTEKLYPELAWQFFEDKLHIQIAESKSPSNNPNQEKIKLFQDKLNSGEIIQADLQKKSDLKSQVLEYYIDYPKPTILFLGNIGTLSIPFQEGLLKLLEEPPKNLFIFLLAPGKFRLLPTITSRSLIHSLDKKYIYSLIDPQTQEKLNKYLPKPSNHINYLLKIQSPSNSEAIDSKNLSKLERVEIDMWLWQIQEYLENLILQKTNLNLDKLLLKVLQARKFNFSNLQKKLVIATLEI